VPETGDAVTDVTPAAPVETKDDKE